MLKVLLYQKTIKKDGKEFSIYKTNYSRFTFDTVIKKTEELVINSEMIKRELKFPVLLTLDDSDYFTKTETYEKDGNVHKKYKLVITNHKDIEQGEFDNTRTLDDIIKELEEEAE